MGNKIGSLLSLLVLLQFLLFSGNLIHYQIMVARLYAIVPIVNDYLSYKGEINEEITQYVFETNGAQITCLDYCFAFSGDFLRYQLEMEIEPIFNSIGVDQKRTLIIIQKVLVGY